MAVCYILGNSRGVCVYRFLFIGVLLFVHVSRSMFLGLSNSVFVLWFILFNLLFLFCLLFVFFFFSLLLPSYFMLLFAHQSSIILFIVVHVYIYYLTFFPAPYIWRFTATHALVPLRSFIIHLLVFVTPLIPSTRTSRRMFTRINTITDCYTLQTLNRKKQYKKKYLQSFNSFSQNEIMKKTGEGGGGAPPPPYVWLPV